MRLNKYHDTRLQEAAVVWKIENFHKTSSLTLFRVLLFDLQWVEGRTVVVMIKINWDEREEKVSCCAWYWREHINGSEYNSDEIKMPFFTYFFSWSIFSYVCHIISVFCLYHKFYPGFHRSLSYSNNEDAFILSCKIDRKIVMRSLFPKLT